MRRTILPLLPTGILLLSLAAVAEPAFAQRDNSEPRSSPNAKISQTIGSIEIDMHYGRPGVRGRDIFGDLVPWDQPWRAGANEPTTITFSDDVSIEGQQLEAGTYNLFIRPAQNGSWTVYFTTPVRWGTMFDDATPVLELNATPQTGTAQEWLTYRFEDLSENSATLVMHWDEVILPIQITAGG